MILRHPAFEHITREVSSKDAKAWKDAGWLAVDAPVGRPMIKANSDTTALVDRTAE